MLNFEQNLAIVSHQRVFAICNLLFRSTQVNYFDYTREYDDYSRIWLGTNPHWTLYLYDKEYVKVTDFRKNGKLLNTGWYTWDGLAKSVHFQKERELFYSKLSDAKNCFKIMNGIALVENQHQFREYYSFGTNNPDCQIIDEYLLHKESFDTFILYFKQEAHDLIKKANDQRIILPYSRKEKIFIDPPENQNCFEIDKYFLNGKYRDIYLSKRQYECLKYLAQGNKIKAVAKILAISPKTVESHLELIKRKLSCHTTSQLLDIFHSAAVTTT